MSLLASITANAALGPPVFNSACFGFNNCAVIETVPLTVGALSPNTPLTFTISNTGSDTLTNVSFTDSLAPGLKVDPAGNGLGGSCVGTVVANPGATSIAVSGITLTSFQTCTITINVIGVVAGHQTTTTSAVTSNETPGSTSTITASVEVVAPPVLTKTFSPTRIPQTLDPTATPQPNVSTLTFTVTNPAANTVNVKGISISDVFPDGFIQVANPSALSPSTCGGATINAVPGDISVSFSSGATLAPGITCTFSFNVIGKVPGTRFNTVTATTSNTVSAAPVNTPLTVVGPPILHKSFSPVGIKVGATTTLSFLLSSQNIGNQQSLSGIAFTDTIPAGLTITAPGSTSVCGGTLTTTATTVSLSGATLAPGFTCPFSVGITATATGIKDNKTSTVSSIEGGTGPLAEAIMSVLAPPAVTKQFGASSIQLNGVTSVTLQIANPNTDAVTGGLSGVGLTDNLPAGLLVASPTGASTTCAGTFTPTAGANSVSISGLTLAASGSCTVTFNVTGTTIGVKPNFGTGTSTETGNGPPSPTVNLLVIGPPTLTKVFNPNSIIHGTTTTLTFTVTNPNATTSLSGVGFSDNFPAGVVVAAAPNPSNSCGGTFAPVAGAASISLSGVTLSANTPCTLSVDVTGTVGGAQLNTTGAPTSAEGGSGTPASNTLTVILGPTLTKTFTPDHILPGAPTTLTLLIANPAANTVPLTGVGIIDVLPGGITIVTTFAQANPCGTGSTVTATAGSSVITLIGGTLPVGGSCSISVTVTSNNPGSVTNFATPTSINGGTGTPGSGTLFVALLPPTFTKTFGSATIPVSGSTTLTFAISNPNAAAISNIVFSDTLPAGLVATAPLGASSACGGTLTVSAGSIALAGGALAASSSCNIVVTVSATSAGPKHNVTSTLTTTETTPTPPATADIPAVGPPLMTKAFNPSTILVNGTSTLTFNLSNPAANSVALTGVGFIDALPGGVLVANPANVSNSCGGVLSASPGSNSITLSGVTLAPSGSCSISVTVVGNTAGQKNNSATPTSANGGSGDPALATLIVNNPGLQPPTITKSFASPTVLPGGTVALTLTIANPNSIPLTGVAVTDNLPAGLSVTNPNGLVNTCGGTVNAAPFATTINLINGVIAANSSCTITLNVTAANLPPTYICNTTSEVTDDQTPPSFVATTCITIGNTPLAPTGAFQIRYASNLDRGDSVINLTNNGYNGANLNGPGFGVPLGNICVNAYSFSPDEQLISCCSCLITPNGLANLSVTQDLISNTLTGVRPNSVVVKLLATQPLNNVCNAALPTFSNLAGGMHAYGTTLHTTNTAALALVETPFSNATISAEELAHLTGLCTHIQGNGSSFGICRSCRAGGLGASKF